MEYPEGLERYKLFAKFLLEGQVLVMTIATGLFCLYVFTVAVTSINLFGLCYSFCHTDRTKLNLKPGKNCRNDKPDRDDYLMQ